MGKEVENGIKSKERVSKYGEVYTPDFIVKDMLDLVKDESYDLNTTYLEPTCGNGNFLIEILDRKLQGLVKDNKLCFSTIVIAVSKIYGVDIMYDNIYESKERLKEVINRYISLTDDEVKIINTVLDRNILWGDILKKEGYKPSCPAKRAEALAKANKPVSKSNDILELVSTEWNFRTDNGEVYVECKDFSYNDISKDIHTYKERCLKDVASIKFNTYKLDKQETLF